MGKVPQNFKKVPAEKWGQSLAKEMLKLGIKEGRITADTDKVALHRSHEEHFKWKISNFKRNLTNLLKGPQQKKIKWSKSVAKALLKEDIVEGHATDKDDAKDVYLMRPEYKDFKCANFRTNLGNLVAKIHKDFDRMLTDCECYGHDLGALRDLLKNQPPVPTPWHLSEAKALLAEAIDNGEHEKMKLARLYKTKPEYREFSLTVFRKHLHQELYKREKKARNQRSKKADARARRRPEYAFESAPRPSTD